MANAIYPKYKQAAIGGGANHDLIGGNVKAMLIDLADYTYSASHEFLSDVAGAGIVATSPNLSTKTNTNGAFDSDNPTFSLVTGDPCEALILYIDTGVAGTSRLVFFQDTGVTGLPVTPSGGDIIVQVDAAGWFIL